MEYLQIPYDVHENAAMLASTAGSKSVQRPRSGETPVTHAQKISIDLRSGHSSKKIKTKGGVAQGRTNVLSFSLQ